MKTLVVAGLLALGACRAPVTVTPAQPQPTIERPIEQQKGLDSLSRQTQQLLRLYGLEDRLPRYPTAVVAVLNGLQGSELGHEALAAEAEVALFAGRNVASSARSEASGWYLQAAARAFEFMFDEEATPMERAMDPRFQRMRRVYNLAVSSYVGLLEQTPEGFSRHDERSRFERYRVEIDLGSCAWDIDKGKRFLVARDLDIRGLRNRYRRDGLGAALVAYRANDQATQQDRFHMPDGYSDPVTAVLTFGDRPARRGGEPRQVELSFYDPRETDSISIGSLEVPLQADFTSHYAYLASVSSVPRLARKGLLNPEDYDHLQGVFLMEPYDPERIPVIMVHGLKSSPLAWMELTNDLFGDELLRDQYQIWHFQYPSGLPYLYVGMVFRSRLEALRQELDPEGDDAAMQSMVIVAHSMGGLVTRSLVCDSGMKVFPDRYR